MSGVTSRTLRHYDGIGLLPPAGVAGNGYRYYEQDHFAGGAVSDALQVRGDGELPGAELVATARGCDVGQEAAAVGFVGGGGSGGDHGHGDSSTWWTSGLSR